MNLVNINSVSKKFDEMEAISNVTFNIQKGEIITILGPNGAGKTTLIKMLTGYLKPTSGSIEYNGNITSGVVFGGDLGFYNNMTAFENLVFFSKLKKISRKEIITEVNRVLSIVSLTKDKDIKVKSFSKGMKQRLHIARGILGNPQLLFLDEPTNGLDIEIASDIRKLIKALKDKGTTIVLTTHVLSDIEELSENMILLGAGKVKYKCTIKEFLEMGKEKLATEEVNIEKTYLAIVGELKR